MFSIVHKNIIEYCQRCIQYRINMTKLYYNYLNNKHSLIMITNNLSNGVDSLIHLPETFFNNLSTEQL